jgi:hypothetical protein
MKILIPWTKVRKHRLTTLILNIQKSSDAVKLTPEEYETLEEMFISNDSGNHVMAYEVLKNLDVQRNLIYLVLAIIEFPGMRNASPASMNRPGSFPHMKLTYTGTVYGTKQDPKISNQSINTPDWELLKVRVNKYIIDIIRDNHYLFKDDLMASTTTRILTDGIVDYGPLLLARLLVFYPEDNELIEHRLTKSYQYFPHWASKLIEDFDFKLIPKFKRL